ncbi:prefoldin subunit alpha [Candidatus Woesearchaeota archaeon]|nr:prefoldin subunit alpha [Candidatus Woesearchaeota archaeon]
MDNEIQNKYLELQMIGQQIKQVQQQIQALDNRLMELNVVEQSLDDLGEVKTGTEILVPISSGIFAKAELKDNKDLMVNVGANTVVKKTIPKTKDMLTEQTTEINKYKEQMLMQVNQLIEHAKALEKEIEEKAK